MGLAMNLNPSPVFFQIYAYKDFHINSIAHIENTYNKNMKFFRRHMEDTKKTRMHDAKIA